MNDPVVFRPTFYCIVPFPRPAKAKRTMQRRRQTCWRIRANQEGPAVVGGAVAGRLHGAFKNAGDGRGVERRGDENGGARKGELTVVRQRCCKWQHMSWWQVKKQVQQDLMRQPAGANKEGQSGMDSRGGCATKGDARQRRHDKRQHGNYPANRGKQEERN